MQKQIIFLSSLTIAAAVTGCQTVSPRAGSNKIIVHEETAPKCLEITSRSYLAPPIGVFNREKAKENLLVKIKNDALILEADNIFIEDESENNFKEISLNIIFYSCKSDTKQP